MPDRNSRRMLFLPSGAMTPLERCEDLGWLTAPRMEARTWLDQFPQVAPDWLLTAIGESPRHAYLHTALGRMSGTPNTGGLRTNLKRAKETTALYGVESSEGSAFEVALCHRDPAFEGGPSRLFEVARDYAKGLISLPPSLARLRELDACRPKIDIIVLPPSPLMSNLLRLQIATPALIRRSTMMPIRPRRP